jgi:mannitol/fructose-specific phosphotransferase system IIA component (Ntr-type)
VKVSAYLRPDVIQLNLDAVDWESALRRGGDLLLKAGKCTPAYVDAMVAAVREMGPYIVLAPGVALGHARPGDGATGIGMSLVTLAEPVCFGSPANDPVWLVISFCAQDDDSHIDMLKDLACFLREKANLNRLRQAKTVPDVLKIISNTERGGERHR